MREHRSDWHQEHADMLRDCLGTGMSHGKAAEAINKRFGTNYSRNAAIGKAHRRGWFSSAPLGKRPMRSFPIRPGYRLVAPPKRAPRPKPLSTSIPKLPREEVAMRCVDNEPLNLSLIDLPSNGCRWPTQDQPFGFCGHSKMEPYCVGLKQITPPYCPAHQRLASRDTGGWERPDRAFACRKNLRPSAIVIATLMEAEDRA